MARNKLRFRAGIEDDTAADVEFNIDIDTDNVTDEGTLIDPTTDEGEQSFEETQTDAEEISADVDQTEDTIDKLEDTQEAFEQVARILQNGIENNGGVSPETLEALRVAMEYRAFDRGLVYSVMPTVEACSRNKLVASNEMMDTVKDTMKKIWEKIKEMFKKLVAMLKNLWIKLFDGAKRLKKKAEKVRDRANNTTGTIEDKKIELSFAGSLTDGDGKPYSEADFIKAIGNLGGTLEVLLDKDNFEAESDTVASAIKGLLEVLAKTTKDDPKTTEIGQAIVKIKEAMSHSKTTLPAGKTAITANNKYDEAHGLLYPTFGGHAIYVLLGGAKVDGKFDNSAQGLRKSLTNRGIRFDKVSKKAKTIEMKRELVTLSSGDCASVAEEVIAYCDTISAFNKGWEKREKYVASMIKEFDGMLKDFNNDEANKDMSPENKSKVRNAVEGFSGGIRADTTARAQIAKHALTVGNYALLYANASLGKHKNK